MQPTPELDPRDVAALAEEYVLLDGGEKRLVAPNRIVYQPMEAGDAGADGGPTARTLDRYRARARGRAGIDFVEALAVSPEGRAREDQLVLAPDTRAGFQELVTTYRRLNDETPLLFQLTHSGRFAAKPVTPYPLQEGRARLLVDDDMARIQDDLVRATRLAAEVGADGIDFKHCHGYLCGAMLGPANVDRRDWSWGGESLAARTRFLTETLARMRAEVSDRRFLYTVRLSAFEGIPGGFGSRDATSAEADETLAELTALVRILEQAGVALINQSAGVPEITPLLVRQTNENPLAFFDHQRYAEAIKRVVGVPVVGSGYSYPAAGKNRLPGDDASARSLVTLGGRAVRDGRVDFVGIGRQSLADPEFAKKLLVDGRADEIHWDTACSRCAIMLRTGPDVGCVTFDPEAGERFRASRRKSKTSD